MIVCVCQSVSDRHIRGAIQDGVVSSFEELQVELGVALRCGKCERHVRAMLVDVGACAVAAPGSGHPIHFQTHITTGARHSNF